MPGHIGRIANSLLRYARISDQASRKSTRSAVVLDRAKLWDHFRPQNGLQALQRKTRISEETHDQIAERKRGRDLSPTRLPLPDRGPQRERGGRLSQKAGGL